jgi:hypothetical protein
LLLHANVVTNDKISFIFLRLHRILLYVYMCINIYITRMYEYPVFFYLLIYWWTQDNSKSWLFWIVLQWTWKCRYLAKTLILVPLNVYPIVGLQVTESYGSSIKVLRKSFFHIGYTKLPHLFFISI